MLMDEGTKEVYSITSKYKELIEKAEQYNLETVELYRKMYDEIVAIREDNLVETDIFGMSEKDWDDLKANFEQFSSLASSAKGIAESYFSLQSQEEKAALAEYEANNQKKRASLDKRLKSGYISELRYNAEISRLDKALDIEKKKIAIAEAERTKKIRKFDTIINTAAAIIGFLANPGGYSGVALSVAAGITGGLQLAAINKAEIPKFGKGARVNKPTIAEIGEAGPEIVLSSGIVQSKTFGPIADDLARIQEGRQPRFLGKPSVPDFGGMKEAIGRSVVNSVTNNTVVNQVNNKAIDSLKEEISEMKESIFDMTKSVKEIKYLRAIITDDDLTEHDDEKKLRLKYSGF